MRRTVVLILLVLLCMAVSVSGALAGFLGEGAADEQRRAGAYPVHVPAVLPQLHDGADLMYGYRTDAALVASVRGPSAPAPRTPGSAGGGATVVVTAVVLPVRTIEVRDGVVVRISSNTPDLRGRNSLYQVRDADDLDAGMQPLTEQIWQQARRHLARATARTGTIWAAG